MPVFQVYCPSQVVQGQDISLTLEEANWMAALQQFLRSLGEDPGDLAGMICDTSDAQHFRLTFPNSNRWFRLDEISGATLDDKHVGDVDVDGDSLVEENLEAQVPPPQPRESVNPSDLAKPEPAAPLPSTALERSTKPMRIATAAALESSDLNQAPAVITTPTPNPTPATGSSPVAMSSPAPKGLELDEILEEIFTRSTELLSEAVDPDLVVTLFLDMALHWVPSGAGAMYAADISSHELSYAALRSPRAQKVLAAKQRLHMGQGLVGLVAQEGRSLRISPLEAFPEFFAEVAFISGLPPKSTLCVALEHEGRSFGAVQLINRRSPDELTEATGFSPEDQSILEAIANQVAGLLAQSLS